MNYATKELTASLQELTTKSQQPAADAKPLPESLAAGEFAFSKEVEGFLEKTQAYSAKTRNISVGTY
ncbi:MAG: hypothetical protein AB1705_16215 [Verrucomicrobiota bacterium]